MPKIGNQVNHSDLPCDRCNSKRKVAKVWTETIKTEYSTMVLRHSKIICTNKECQMAFEKLILEESLKREMAFSALLVSLIPT